jgi:signal transduction histidine kinase
MTATAPARTASWARELPARAAAGLRALPRTAVGTGQGWLRTAGSARPARIVYELVLTASLACLTALTSLFVSELPVYGAIFVGVTTAIVVPLRLVYPVGAFVAGAVLGSIGGGESIYLLIALSASAGYRLRRIWPTVLAFAVALGLWLASSVYWSEVTELPMAIWLVAAFLLFGVLPAVIGRVIAQRRALISAMHDRNVQLHQQQTVVAEQARTRERTRIARDMHDSLGHQLTLISLYAGALDSAPEPQRSEAVALLRSTSAAAMNELRLILGILHQDDSGAAVAKPLTSLGDLVDASTAAGAQVSVTTSGQRRPLPPLIEHAAYRVIQEGLTNALRHAGGAPVEVALRYEPDALIAEVINGPGAPHQHPTSAQGLIGLSERVRLAGGVLYHGHTPDGGFRLAAILGYEPGTATGDRPLPQATEPPGDFALQNKRSAQTARWVLIGIGVAVLAIMGCMVSVPLMILAAARTIMVDSSTFEAIHVGDDEADVRDQLPNPSMANPDAQGGGSTPSMAKCVDYSASIQTQFENQFENEVIYRFCFRDGKLVEKKRFEDKIVS